MSERRRRHMSYQVGRSSHRLWVEHDDLGGHMTLHSLRHLLHRAVDGQVFDFEPVVSVPANEEPDVLLPVQLLLVHLQMGDQ